ncbi:MAG: PspA/IM30 family protein [Planktothrix agardhii KL2]|jgi:phage shock protein A|uniref:PspA/IM30 family protein n=1 Tax=Planktothrix agardhii TaxID=1160 RepID=UPI001A1CC559|nr:PspA/IM30 family protein [Planktothrix agardhii]MBG0745380.1 PspA/IM30 family protein [Planktothrix agardhii KL2]MCF3575579.1 PspA/IM30 family protein [Planktothrix agardhii 1812]MCF3580597.1 PspA/IM30 family protein [Planktothrix agardhii 1811]MCF3625186.1 PspA/IM30 family protein [Planktothrix agardhii 1801]
MGQLFNRMGRLIRANVNSNLNSNLNSYETDSRNFAAGSAFATGGALTGASVGQVGILAAGTGFSVGTVGLSGAGALTGLALYETIRMIVEGDTSSVGAATTGAVAGAGLSATIGGIGVATGGTAFGVGMVSMGAAGAIAGLGIAGLIRLLKQQGIDPEKLLEQAVLDMQEDVIKFRQAIVPVIVAQKRLEQQYNQTKMQVDQWQSRAKLALKKGYEDLAIEALKRKKLSLNTLNTIKQQLDTQTEQVTSLKHKLLVFEQKVSEAKSKKSLLISKIKAAKAQAEINNRQNLLGGINSDNATTAFERMEEKVRQLEARSAAARELAGSDFESKFAALEAGSDVDDELAALKAQISGNHTISDPNLKSNTCPVDDELEQLRQELNKM